MWECDQWKKWRLVAKLDPDKALPPQALEIIRDKNIDAVMVGGSQGINYVNTQKLVQLIRESGFSGPGGAGCMCAVDAAKTTKGRSYLCLDSEKFR